MGRVIVKFDAKLIIIYSSNGKEQVIAALTFITWLYHLHSLNFVKQFKLKFIVEEAVKKLTTELDAKLVAKPIVPFVIVLNKDITEAEPVTSIEGEVPV